MVGVIAAVGNKDIVTAFKCVGADIFPYTNESKVREVLRELAASNYTLVFITQQEARESADLINTLAVRPYPIFLPVPDGTENASYGTEHVQEFIAKAFGGRT